MSDSENTPGKPKGALGSLVQAELMVQLAIGLPIGCLVGWFLGNLVDKHFGTHFWAVVGILLGAAGGFIRIFTAAKKMLKDPE
jgi:ATP synthase protein I